MASTRIKQRPTALAWALLGTTACLLLMAMNYQNNIAYLLCSAVFSSALFAVLEARRNMRGITLQLHENPQFFANEIGTCSFICKSSQQRTHYLLQVFTQPESIVYLTHFNQRKAILVSLGHHQRGCYPLPPLTLRSTYPFGLIRSDITFLLAGEMTVFPQAKGNLPLPGSSHGKDREHDDFSGHRRYQVGDPVQRIDWKIIARNGPALIKQFHQGSGNHEHHFQLQALAHLTQEEALEQLCRWVCVAAEAHIPFSMHLGAVSLSSDISQAHRDRCLHSLARHDRSNA